MLCVCCSCFCLDALLLVRFFVCVRVFLFLVCCVAVRFCFVVVFVYCCLMMCVLVVGVVF